MGRAIILLVVALLSGCAGYTLGSVQRTFMKGVHKVAVPIFDNKTLQAQVDTAARPDFVGPTAPTPTPSATPSLTPAQKKQPLTPPKDVVPTEPNLPTQ